MQKAVACHSFFCQRRRELRGQTCLDRGFGVVQGFRQMVRQLHKQLVMQLHLFVPGGFVDAGHGVELRLCEVQARPGQVAVVRAQAENVLVGFR